MKYLLFCFTLLFLSCGIAHAQDFITRGKIEFEVKRNIKKMYTAEQRANNPYIESLPEFDISYRELIFSWNQLIYQQGRKSATAPSYQYDVAIYTDLSKGQYIRKFPYVEDEYILEDSVKKVKWKIQNETRKIAGWECRKAVGRIKDSVYVVAFYCPEIVPQGGPELFTGLPGMILGIAIPRSYSTWFATKVEVANIDESKIVPPEIKKSKVYTKQELTALLYKKYIESGGDKKATVESFMMIFDRYTL
jgi:GLPGLI family protein